MEDLTRADLVPLIGKKVDMVGKGASHAGVIIVEVGETHIVYKWPSRDDLLLMEINMVGRIAWNEETRMFVGQAYQNEQAERFTA